MLLLHSGGNKIILVNLTYIFRTDSILLNYYQLPWQLALWPTVCRHSYVNTSVFGEKGVSWGGFPLKCDCGRTWVAVKDLKEFSLILLPLWGLSPCFIWSSSWRACFFFSLYMTHQTALRHQNHSWFTASVSKHVEMKAYWAFEQEKKRKKTFYIENCDAG